MTTPNLVRPLASLFLALAGRVACLALVGLGTLSSSSLAAPGDLLASYSTGGAVFASPTLDREGTLYIGSNDGRFYALRGQGASFSQGWVYTADDWIDSSAAVGPDGTLYVCTYNSTLVGLDPETGEERFSVIVGQDEGAFGIIQSSPAVASDGTVVVTTTAGFAHAFDPGGQALWSFAIGAASQSSPVIDAQHRIFFGAEDGVIYCLNLLGELQWEYPVDGAGSDSSAILGSPALDGEGNVYIGSGNGFLYALAPDGSLRWKFETPEAVDATPAIDGENQCYFASRNGSLYAVDPTGALLWSVFLGDIFFSSPVIDAEGFVYATYFGGQGRSFVVAIAPGGVELWETQVDTVIDSSLTLSPDGVLYVGGFDGRVYAIEGQGAGLDYESPWPRFRRDTRGRGRVIAGELPEIMTPPASTVTSRGGSVEFQVTLGQQGPIDEPRYHWRRNGKVLSTSSVPHWTLSEVTDEGVGVYDVVVSNLLGEVVSRPAFLALVETPLPTVEGAMTRFVTRFRYPDESAFASAQILQSSDLVTWTAEGIGVELLSTGTGFREVEASLLTSASRVYLRLEAEVLP